MTRKNQCQKLFVRGIPVHTTQDQLRHFFASFGPVEMVLVPKQKTTRKNKGIAYVVMKLKKDFDYLVELGNVDYNGKSLEVLKASSPKSIELIKLAQIENEVEDPIEDLDESEPSLIEDQTDPSDQNMPKKILIDEDCCSSEEEDKPQEFGQAPAPHFQQQQ